jgi:four helix bundle protein
VIVGVVVVVGVDALVIVGGKRGRGRCRSDGTNLERSGRTSRSLGSDIARMLTYKKLDVYRCAIDLLALALAVLEARRAWRGNAILADQLRRAALSIPLNIGEGAGKSTPPDQTKHYVIARGSAMECGAIFDAALVLKLVDEETAGRAEDLVTRIVGMLTKMCHFR